LLQIEDESISGARAGACLVTWESALERSVTPDEIEGIRQKILNTKDIYKIRKNSSKRGVNPSAKQIQAVKEYIFNSRGIAFMPDNYKSWRRLSSDNALIDDVRFLVHELTEVGVMQSIQVERNFDFLGRNTSEKTMKERAQWQSDFSTYYEEAHRKALHAEDRYLSKEVQSLANVRIAPVVAACIDPTRSEGRQYMDVDGYLLKDHPHFQNWQQIANISVPIGNAKMPLLGGYRNSTKGELLRLIKRVKLIYL
jgi:hypothetical protein